MLTGKRGDTVLGILLEVIPFLAGAALFSFFDLVVFRLPRGEKILLGRSRCESCGHCLPPQDLIPVLGWLMRRGRCRFCGQQIPVHCLGMEVIGGATGLLMRWSYGSGWNLRDGGLGLSWQAWWALAVVGTLVAVARLDLKTGLIPDPLNGILLAAGILAGFLFSTPTWPERLLGGVCVSVPMYLLCLVVPDAFGGGDIKLMAAAGVLLGWPRNVLAIFLALLGGGAAASVLLLSARIKPTDHLAFGPYLCAGIGISILFGDPILAWYLG